MFLNRLLGILFPEKCIFCGEITNGGYGPCGKCESRLPFITGKLCAHCGLPSEECRCYSKNHLYVRCIAPAYYIDEMQKAVKMLKFSDFPKAAIPLAALMAKSVNEHYAGIHFDVIASVPMTKRAVRKRGYNQAALLADELAKLIKVKHDPLLLYKNRETGIQHKLSARNRVQNVSGAFSASPRVKGKCVLLVDDISTTGETFAVCTKALLEQGASSVYCVSAAAVIKQ
ncbi:MAG: ComF family protein [Oscillospiraceae bacterium]|nr:ComF family protein [Oscillospiraceae bacterium]